MALTFWSVYMDNEFLQRRDINSQIEKESLDVGALDYRIRQLNAQVHELSLALAAMMKVMSEMGQLDPRAVQMRVDAELEAMRPPAPPANQVNPKKPATPDVAVTCEGCGKQVSSTRTTITERGTLCDSCAGV